MTHNEFLSRMDAALEAVEARQAELSVERDALEDLQRLLLAQVTEPDEPDDEDEPDPPLPVPEPEPDLVQVKSPRPVEH